MGAHPAAAGAVRRLQSEPLRRVGCRRSLTLFCVALGALCLGSPSPAFFHLWQFKEVYSNADGSIQYIEIFNANPGENVSNNQPITANSDGVMRVFTFPSNLTGSTQNRHLLIATPGFAALSGAVTPDFTLPCGPFFDPGAASITLTIIGDTLTFSGASLPTDGNNSLTDTTLYAATNLVQGTNSPTNFTGASGSVSLTGCLQLGTCEPCDDGLFCNGAEACSASACVAGAAPCVGACEETGDSCVDDQKALDVDGNGSTDALTDGLLFLRFAFSFTGNALINNAVGPGCIRCTAPHIESHLATLGLVLDVDDNDEIAALTDGLLVLRYLFGFSGVTLTSGATAPDCDRCDAAVIEPYLEGLDY